MTDRAERSPHGEKTRSVHGPAPRPGALGTPVVRSAVFSFETLEALRGERDRGADGAFYQRLGHPTLRACERRLADLEGAEEAGLFASGTAAVTGVFLAHVKPGQHIVSLAQGYGGTLYALRWGAEHLGWTFDLVNAADPSSWEKAFRSETRIFHVETPTNPTLDVIDLARAADLAHRHGALLSVDNTVASPIGQHALRFGADLVSYSATKSIGGHSDLLAGAVLGSRARLDELFRVRVVLGATLDPEVAWLIERSLKTIPLRVRAANQNALELAQRLASIPSVIRVRYPGLVSHPGHDLARRQMSLGFGPLLAFEVEGGAESARKVIDRFKLIQQAASLGGVESLACLPAETSHRFMTPDEVRAIGIPDGMIRLSMGIEDIDDLWADLTQALEVLAASRQA